MSEVEVILHPDGRAQIKTHYIKGEDCDALVEILMREGVISDPSDIEWTREHSEPSTRKIVDFVRKFVRRGR
jgi:hypothetical protein